MIERYEITFLHILYTQWLEWKDLSNLDLAFLSHHQRQRWLSTLSRITIDHTASPPPSDVMIGNYYEWLGSRQVFIRDDFPLRLSHLDDILQLCDPLLFCPVIHSIEIGEEVYSEVNQSSLITFLSHCHHLEGVVLWESGPLSADIDNMVISTLITYLKNNKNTLKKIHLFFKSSYFPFSLLNDLITMHCNSLIDVAVYDQTNSYETHQYYQLIGIDDILSILLKNNIELVNLRLFTESGAPWNNELLLNYLSLLGKQLETLQLTLCCDGFLISDDLLLSCGAACPKLTCLQVRTMDPASTRVNQPSRLYELCPNLLSLYLDDYAIDVDDKNCEVFTKLVIAKQSTLQVKEDWLQCLCAVIERTQYKLVTSNFWFCDNLDNEKDEWKNFKSKLGSYLTAIDGTMSDDSLIDAVKELPRLEVLSVNGDLTGITDASLVAISLYGTGLRALTIGFPHRVGRFECSDEMIGQMIQACKALEFLAIPEAGCHSLLAVAQHSCLKGIEFDYINADERELAAIVHNKDVTWPSTLIRGEIRGEHYRFRFVSKAEGWVILPSE